MYSTIASYTDPIEAHIVCGRLVAEGIDAHVADNHTALGNWEWRSAIGGTKVRVASAQFDTARGLIVSLDSGEFALDPSEEAAVHRETWSSRIAYVMALWLGIPLPWRRKRAE